MRYLRMLALRASRSSWLLFGFVLIALVAGSVLPVAAAPTALPITAPQAYPQYIRVGRTFNSRCVARPTVQRVDVVPFKDYVKSVLPHEWYASWTDASLDAGAVAVAQFAYQTAFVEKKWSRRGYNFDVVDSTCDQYYVAGRTHPRTNAAVERMWGTMMLRNGKPFTPFYRSNDRLCRRVKDCMSQWGSQRLGQQGWTGPQILRHYYGNIAVVRNGQTLR